MASSRKTTTEAPGASGAAQSRQRDGANQSLAGSGALDIDHFRQKLQELERDLVKRLGQDVDAARITSDDQFDPGDLAVVDELRDEYFALADTDSAILAQVRAALTRIDEGTYGQCLVDGEPIELKRLEFVPWTPYCLKHQQEREEHQRVRTPSL